MEIQAIPPFDIVGDVTCVGPRWKRWRRSFEFYIAAKGVTSDVQKRALLLHTAGMAVQDLFETLSDPGPPGGNADDAASAYDVAMRTLDAHFSPKLNTPYERHVFRQMKQESKETVDQFVSRLRRQAENCEFGEQLEENVRDQVIDKCSSSLFRRKLLEKGQTLTLTMAQDLGRTMETVALQVQKMEGTPLAVNFAKTEHRHDQKSHGSKSACYRCGKFNHLAKDPNCPAKKAHCRRCGLGGHFEAVCKTKLVPGKPQQNHFASHSKSVKKQVRCVEEQPIDDKPEYVFSLSQEEKGHVALDVGGVVIEMLIDSGASCNVIDQCTWNMMKKKQVKCESRKSTKEIYAYGSETPLKVIGMFSCIVTLRQISINADFYVIEGKGKSLLGRNTAEQLGVLRVGFVRGINTGQDILAEYPECFEGIGKLKGFKAKFYVDGNVRPVAQPVRRIPYNLRGPVEEELAKLLKADIIEKVEGPTPWVSPIIVVPKGGTKEIRICVDMRQANEAVIRERHPIPTVDDVLYHLNEGTVFSRLDLKWGFHQIELDEDSRGITTFIAHSGLFRYKRLMFGISSAPELYQHVIQQVLTGCAGAHNIADDIIVHGKTSEEHDGRLRLVLECLKRNGLTLNRAKCQIGLPKVQFMGHVLSRHGIGPAADKVKAVAETREPENASEVKSFLGLVNFVARYIPDMSTVSEPLRQLIKKDTHFVFGQKEREAFAELKKRLSSAENLAYFEQGAPTQVIADASPVGLGAVLIQKQNGVHRVVCYASKSLSAVERRYSQTEKEALALVWACERFHLYLYGMEFELVTDHKPLEVIYSARSKPSARIERWVLRLQSYNFKVKYVPGPQNIADVLSRLSRSPVTGDDGDDYIKFVAVASTPKALSTSEIERASATDQVLCAVSESLKNNVWPKGEMVEYRVISEELCFIGKILLRGTRIVMPEILRSRTLELAHEGHPGIVQMKKRLRSKVWWPGIDKDCERQCRTCHGCQLVGMPLKPEPMARTQLPNGPWQDLAIDYMGPLPTGEYILVVVDYYSRYYEIEITRTTTAEKVIKSLKQIFATHGLPYSITSDNGPQFTSEVFAEYLKDNDIVHHRTTPLWPQANGEVERQNRSLLQRIKIAQGEGKNWKEELLTYLFAYRTTPHSTLGISPAEALYGRKLRTKLPELRPSVPDDESIRDEDRLKKFKGKEYADDRRRAAEADICIGDKVLMKQPYHNKFTTPFQTKPYTVKSKTGNCTTVESPEGILYKRNVTHLKKYRTRSEASESTHEKEETTVEDMSENRDQHTMEESPVGILEPNNTEPNNTDEPENSDKPNNTDEPENSVETEVAVDRPDVSRRPIRTRQLPAKFKDFRL